MEVHLTPEQESRLAEIAAHEGKDKGQLVREAILSVLDRDADLLAILEKGLSQADRGEFIEEEVDARVERMFPR
jgi:predicted transcriptional regulator